ncbi:hypothetical protein K504DRAFT_372081 [Pleomassaria siparia CBS 279.74]|uniref:Uncharacterized protein n=1 Tax=Pleomassaria siparia CBS 279.74 TaxID=1314801 RepID=A0A6G1KIJ8_9PLEO|nr:hypothetical protein K504DRAFT_372081 [Pleomassaria siparia CBS 279.74]
MSNLPPSSACFAGREGLHLHETATRKLCKAGVWIGYLSSERWKDSYLDYPSFTELSSNCENLHQPFPPPISGLDSDGLEAYSPVFTNVEQKLVIMPLRGEQDEELFCIMIPQPNSRSSDDAQAYRPYEIRHDGQGKSFAKSYVILTRRSTTPKSSRTQKHPIKAPTPESSTKRVKRAPSEDEGFSKALVDAPSKYHRRKRSVVDYIDTYSLGSADEEYVDSNQSNDSMDPKFTIEHMGHIPSSSKKRRSLHEGEQPKRASKRKRTSNSSIEYTASTVDRSQTVTPNTYTAPVIFSQEQAQRVYLIWVVMVDDDEWQFSHALDECNTFSELLNLFREDAELSQEATSILMATKIWHISVQLPGRKKRVFIARTGTEIAFERLQSTLIQSTVWNEHPGIRIDVEFKALTQLGTRSSR